MNPRNDQAALDRQYDEEHHLKRESTVEESLRISGYADAAIRSGKARGTVVNDIGTRGDDSAWIYAGDARRD